MKQFLYLSKMSMEIITNNIGYDILNSIGRYLFYSFHFHQCK